MQIEHDAAGDRFVAISDSGEHMGEICYTVGDGFLTATHTSVEDGFQNRGVAGALLGELVRYAESRGDTIVPVCTFVAAAFKRSPEKYASVIRSI